ncbi:MULTISPECIES: hypothetical protein [Rhizobium]|uniref:hypothetical protein n=1 Tax=Rhizobium TaxID=379 RepID=UPI0007EB17F6|nr:MULTISPECIES: hypothetical protein [Rhizobium]ANK90650.1 hypothetical protein AMK01_CH01142 [Rhizobium sp. N6212]ANK96679.1 hypothetical protein AMK00_CH01144 [Rhizobium sp. N621]ANL02799.1 hypothetical protein AMJ99_CH01212 [Rhizobium esperanzae]ANL08848.1 hypothetical protein AMJ98_CH01133 [Rhizobium sp. N1341]ANL20895.1 hypothetical protein AMJ96_CH01136 [Rhizobium sp. N113]
MPRNPSTGVYSKPAGTTPSVGQVIDPAPWNALTTDLGNEITNSLPRDGSAPMTAPLKAASGTVSAPGIGFATNPQTGLYLKGGGLLGFTQNGVDVSFEKALVYSAKSGDYTAAASDDNAVNRFTQAATLTLSAAATLGANWHYCVIADGGDVTIDPTGSETIDGAATLVLKNGYSVNIICSGAAFFTNKLAARIESKADSSAVGDFVVGLILSNNGASPNTHIDFTSGSARSGSSFVSSAASFTKRVTGTFAAGTGAGGLDAGAVAANATYFAYALRKDADLSFDVVFSTSPTIGGITTTLLTGYTIVKCFGVVLTDGSSNIRPFVMYPRDEYTFVTPVKDAVSAAISTTSTLLALTAPNGVKVKAKLRFEFTSSATTNAALLSDPAQGALIAGAGNDGANVGSIQVASGFAVGSQEIWTNTSRQIRMAVGGSTGSIWIWTDGFHFPCGRSS